MYEVICDRTRSGRGNMRIMMLSQLKEKDLLFLICILFLWDGWEMIF